MSIRYCIILLPLLPLYCLNKEKEFNQNILINYNIILTYRYRLGTVKFCSVRYRNNKSNEIRILDSEIK